MAKTVVFYFDLGSPATYLASIELPRIAEEADAVIDWRPMLLGAVFKATGNHAPMEVPSKGIYLLADLYRCAARFKIPFRMNPNFPINTLTMMRVVTALQMKDSARFLKATDVLFRWMWAEEKNLGDPSVLHAALEEAGVDAAAALAWASEPAVKDKLRAETEGAIARGVFGAPTMFVGEDMFWGQDRLDFVKAALSQ